MKKGFNILMIAIGAVIFITSCGESTRTYTEMLNDERKAIKKLIDREDIIVLKDFPKDSVFKENEFFQTSSGLYINIVDSGNGNRVALGTDVSYRFEIDYINVLSDTIFTINGFENNYYPTTFTYGTNNLSEDGYLSGLHSQGILEALQFVGDKSTVKLIVPFKIGGEMQRTGGDPVFFRKLRFQFI